MRWNPLYNAIGAGAYIVGIGFLMRYITSIRHDTPDTIFDSMGFLSLLVFSASVMAFLFFYRPVALLIENKKAEALSYFLKTLGIFGLLTVIALIGISMQ